MTLVACSLNKRKIPFIVGDVLWSSKKGKPNLVLPTNIHPIDSLLSQHTPLKPDSFNQKIYVINKRVSICFSGDELEITEFLKELKLKCRYYGDDIEVSNIKTILDDYKVDKRLIASTFFMFYVNAEGTGGMFYHPGVISEFEDGEFAPGWLHMHSEVFGDVYADGSGRYTYLDILSQNAEFTSSHETGEIWNAVQTHLIAIAKMLALEKITALTFKENWGGAFETIFFDGSQFRKFDDVAYVIFHGQFDELGNIGLPMPRLILYYKYYNEYLLITAIEIQEATPTVLNKKIVFTSCPGNFIANYYVIGGLDQKAVDINDLNAPLSFECHTMALGYGIITPKNGTFNPSYFNEHPELGVVHLVDAKAEITVSEEISNELAQRCKKQFPNLQ